MIELYNNLMKICSEAEASKFFFKDVFTPESKYRIFSYHYASYSDWLAPDAIECRGIMFEMKESDSGLVPVRIACRPMEKFFNLNENPLTTDLDLSKIKYATDKLDGSLISSYMDGETLKLKSKTSLVSDQAFNAMVFITNSESYALYEAIKEYTAKGFTFNFEYVSPNNRIVLQYDAQDLIILNARDNNTGEYVPYENLQAIPALRNHLVKRYEIQNPEEWVKETKNAEGIEGYVAILESGQRFKLKTEWYCLLHYTKDSVNSNERLYQAIVGGAADDLRAMFAGDNYAVCKISAFESEYISYLSGALLIVQGYYTEMRGHDRKDYAIKGQEMTNKLNKPELFGTMMMMYAGTMSTEDMVKGIEKAFLKVWTKYVPTLYSKEIQMIEE